jgi:hypothetical protein
MPLSQNEPALIRVGLSGITTIEFPTKIEALDGFGFNANPSPDGPDLFQISFNKGTNFLSLKALRPDVEGNLTVVLDGRVYSLLCQEVSDPSFVVIFEERSGRHSATTRGVPADQKVASPARLLGLLDKLKGFPSLKVSAAEMYQNIDVAEPNSKSSLENLEVTLRRVMRDDVLDTVGFEVELANKSQQDCLYDPESFAIRVADEVYQQAVSDAGGLVPAGKSETAFFAVTGTATGGRNDLAVTNQFDVIVRPVTGERDPHRKVSAEWQEPPAEMPKVAPHPVQELPKNNKMAAQKISNLEQKSKPNSAPLPNVKAVKKADGIVAQGSE